MYHRLDKLDEWVVLLYLEHSTGHSIQNLSEVVNFLISGPFIRLSFLYCSVLGSVVKCQEYVFILLLLTYLRQNANIMITRVVAMATIDTKMMITSCKLSTQ